MYFYFHTYMPETLLRRQMSSRVVRDQHYTPNVESRGLWMRVQYSAMKDPFPEVNHLVNSLSNFTILFS